MDESRVLEEIRVPPGARQRVMDRRGLRAARRRKIREAGALSEFNEDMERPGIARFFSEINLVDIPRLR